MPSAVQRLADLEMMCDLAHTTMPNNVYICVLASATLIANPFEQPIAIHPRAASALRHAVRV